MKRIVMWAGVFILLLVLISGLAGDVQAQSAKVKMGALLPRTGPLAEFAKGFEKAGNLAIGQFAEAGFPIEIRYADTETSAIPGVEAARPASLRSPASRRCLHPGPPGRWPRRLEGAGARRFQRGELDRILNETYSYLLYQDCLLPKEV